MKRAGFFEIFKCQFDVLIRYFCLWSARTCATVGHLCFSQTAGSYMGSTQIGSGVVRSRSGLGLRKGSGVAVTNASWHSFVLSTWIVCASPAQIRQFPGHDQRVRERPPLLWQGMTVGPVNQGLRVFVCVCVCVMPAFYLVHLECLPLRIMRQQLN